MNGGSSSRTLSLLSREKLYVTSRENVRLEEVHVPPFCLVRDGTT